MNQDSNPPPKQDLLAFLSGGGEMGERIRAFDWSKTPVGPVGDWPQSLRSAVSFLLPSKAQIVLFWGPDFLTFYNDTYRPVFGGKHPHVLGLPAREAWAELWATNLKELLEGVVNTGEAFWASDRPFFVERYGFLEETLFDVSYDPVRDESGRVGGVFCIVSETTTRVLAARRMRTMRELAARTAEAAKSVERACEAVADTLAENPYDLPFTLLYLLDGDGRRARLAGRTGIGRDTSASPGTIDLEDRAAPWPFRQVVETGRAVEVHDLPKAFGPLPGGAWPESPRQAVVLPMVKPGQTQLAGFVVAGVSPRLAFHDEYKGFMGLLAGHIATAVANARAYEEERRRAEALAELDRAKTAFFSNVSHEFRTPLTLILGPLEDALAETQEHWQRDRLELLHRNALRLQKLVNTLLDFSRIEAGRIQASYEPTDLAALTSELASVFRSAVEKAGMRLIVHCPPLGEPVYVDRDMYEKIVLNLLSNAFKFTLEGEIEVQLRTGEPGALATGVLCVELSVRDTGSGIAEEQLPHIFERFHRVEGVRARTHEGTGIGLALVQELVKLHGGTVSVQSSAGRGSTFTVAFPKGKAHLPADRIGTARRLTSTALAADHYLEEALRWLPSFEDKETGRQGDKERENDNPVSLSPCLPVSLSSSRPRIVWADDNTDMREYVARLLSPLYDVDAVADGEAALVAVHRQLPDLVLADVMMPPLDGFGLLRQLRADESTRAIPVILLSARAGEEARVEGMEAGADDYLVKPFGARELVACVDAHLKMARLRREGEQALRAREALLAGQKEAFQAAMSGAPLETALGVLVRTAVEQTRGDLRAAFYTISADGTSLYHVTGMPEVYARRINGFRIGPESLACGLATHTGEPVITRDVMEEPLWEPWRWLAREHDYRACWSFLVRTAGGPILGTLAWYFREPRDPAPGDLELAAVLTHAAAIIMSRQAEAEERKRAEEAVRRSEEKYRSLFDTIDEGFCVMELVYDPAGRVNDLIIRELNQAFERQTGLKDAVGRLVGSMLPNLERYWLDMYQQVADTGEPARTENYMQDTGRWFRAHYSRVGGPGSRFIAVVFEDITERKRSEEEREQLIGQLRDADRKKNEFLATLAHELRNPLAPIRNGLQVMKLARSNDSTVAQSRAMMERQLGQMVRLVDDLLDVSRISQGKIELRKERIALTEVVATALESCEPIIKQHGHELTVTLPSEPAYVDADKTRLAQALCNLLNNAAKYTENGGHIWLAVERQGSDAVLSVKDTGVGIPAPMLPKVFDLFTQVDRSLEKAHGGLGIGLTIVKRLIEMHGGSIEAKSEGQGMGSEFIIRLPIVLSLVARHETEGDGEPAGPMARRRILVVDDNVDAASSLAMLLKIMGNEVCTARDGLEGVEVAAAFRPDVIFLDIGMPKLNGYDACRRIREQPWGKGMVLVALTGWGQEEDQRRSQEAGFNFHLVKPVDPEALEALLARLQTATA